MRPQDILVLVKMAVSPRTEWTYMGLAHDLSMSSSEVHAAIQRSGGVGLFNKKDRRPVTHALYEFIVHGLKYVFPPSVGAITQGIPTAFGHESYFNKIILSNHDMYVWPHVEGAGHGMALSPLYRAVPDACLRDPALYEAMAHIDSISIGRAREVKFAGERLKRMFRIDG